MLHYTLSQATLSQARPGWNWPKTKQKLSDALGLNFWLKENKTCKKQSSVLMGLYDYSEKENNSENRSHK